MLDRCLGKDGPLICTLFWGLIFEETFGLFIFGT